MGLGDFVSLVKLAVLCFALPMLLIAGWVALRKAPPWARVAFLLAGIALSLLCFPVGAHLDATSPLNKQCEEWGHPMFCGPLYGVFLGVNGVFGLFVSGVALIVLLALESSLFALRQLARARAEDPGEPTPGASEDAAEDELTSS